MKIAPISYYNAYKPQFRGKFYPSGYYKDSEIQMAEVSKEYTNDDWIPCVKAHLLMDVMDEIGSFKFKYTKKGIRLVNERLLRIAKLRSDMLNEDIEAQKVKQQQTHGNTVENLIKINIKKKITDKYLQRLSAENTPVPTAIMIYDGNPETRRQVIDWTLQKSLNKCKTETYDCEGHENQVLYYLESQADYAKERYEKRGLRTLIEMKNFDKFLSQNPAGMKDFMSEISTSHLPITIIFETQDKKILPAPYIGNQVRIPLKIRANKDILDAKDFKILKKPVVKMTPYLDGYEFKLNDKEPVKLFLGNFGHTKHILWAQTGKTETIKDVINNIETIRKTEKFKNVTLLQCPADDFTQIEGMYPTRFYTDDFKQIAQVVLG